MLDHQQVFNLVENKVQFPLSIAIAAESDTLIMWSFVTITADILSNYRFNWIINCSHFGLLILWRIWNDFKLNLHRIFHMRDTWLYGGFRSLDWSRVKLQSIMLEFCYFSSSYNLYTTLDLILSLVKYFNMSIKSRLLHPIAASDATRHDHCAM